MEFKVQLVVCEAKAEPKVINILEINKEVTGIETIGLTLAESKSLLNQAQAVVIQEQVAHYLSQHLHCPNCNNPYRLKGFNLKKLNTLFGSLTLKSPRFYTCLCQANSIKSFSPLTTLLTNLNTPELLYLETKYAALMSYGLTTKLLKDLLPIGNKLNAMSIRNHTMAIAQESEQMLGNEQYFFIEGCPYLWEQLPKPTNKITMGIDGGYLRQWDNKKKNFEVIAGKSMASKDNAKYFGLVQSVDTKPKRRVYEVLNLQGMQANQTVEFLSDGADNVRDLQRFLNPNAQHILDWFHVSMRFTVLLNYAKGYHHYESSTEIDLVKELTSAKWHLWHGHRERGYEKLEDVACFINEESQYPNLKKFEKALDEMLTYVYRNSPMIINYGKRWRQGERISTGFVESTINCFITKRFAKKQQMQWTAKGAHLLMQVRAKVMNNELEQLFKKWHPKFGIAIATNDEQLVSANIAA